MFEAGGGGGRELELCCFSNTKTWHTQGYLEA